MAVREAHESDILEPLFAKAESGMDLATAKELVRAKFPDTEFARVQELSEKANEGLLSEDEGVELDHSLRNLGMLACWHAEAELFLRARKVEKNDIILSAKAIQPVELCAELRSLAQFLDLVESTTHWDPSMVSQLLNKRISAELDLRLTHLGEKANEGSISAEEQAELDETTTLLHRLSLRQAIARDYGQASR